MEPPGPCHFPLIGWTEFARMVQPLIERDFYGRAVTSPMTAPNVIRAYYTSNAKNEIALEFDQPVVWSNSLINEFYLDGVKEKVASGRMAGNVVILDHRRSQVARLTPDADQFSRSLSTGFYKVVLEGAGREELFEVPSDAEVVF